MHYSEFYKELVEKIEIPEDAKEEFSSLVKKLDEDLQFGREVDKLIMRFMRDAIKTQDFEEDERRLHDLPEIYPENIAVLAKNINVALNNMQK